jgi:hypothetical protein
MPGFLGRPGIGRYPYKGDDRIPAKIVIFCGEWPGNLERYLARRP